MRNTHVKIDENDPLYETFVGWRDAASVDPCALSNANDIDVQDFVDYAVDMLNELEQMAEQKKLQELAGSLALCKNLARLSGCRR